MQQDEWWFSNMQRYNYVYQSVLNLYMYKL